MEIVVLEREHIDSHEVKSKVKANDIILNVTSRFDIPLAKSAIESRMYRNRRYANSQSVLPLLTTLSSSYLKKRLQVMYPIAFSRN